MRDNTSVYQKFYVAESCVSMSMHSNDMFNIKKSPLMPDSAYVVLNRIGEATVLEVNYFFKDGKGVPLLMITEPLVLEEGHLSDFEMILKDVSFSSTEEETLTSTSIDGTIGIGAQGDFILRGSTRDMDFEFTVTRFSTMKDDSCFPESDELASFSGGNSTYSEDVFTNATDLHLSLTFLPQMTETFNLAPGESATISQFDYQYRGFIIRIDNTDYSAEYVFEANNKNYLYPSQEIMSMTQSSSIGVKSWVYCEGHLFSWQYPRTEIMITEDFLKNLSDR